MQTKICFKCGGSPQPISEFYKHPMMADGHLNKCKTCTKKDTIENRHNRIEYYRKYDRYRGTLPHRLEAVAEYRKTPEGKKAIKGVTQRWQQKNPRKRAAHLLFGRAIASGKVTKCLCERCGAAKVHGHHENYDEPLKVVWLCAKHHRERHQEMKAQGIKP